jgi:hypothetical protein
VKNWFQTLSSQMQLAHRYSAGGGMPGMPTDAASQNAMLSQMEQMMAGLALCPLF